MQAARIVERMINQNLHNDLAMDFKVCTLHSGMLHDAVFSLQSAPHHHAADCFYRCDRMYMICRHLALRAQPRT